MFCCREQAFGGAFVLYYRSIGKYGMMRKQYLKEHKSGRFGVMVIKGELDQHLADVDEQPRDMVEKLMDQMMKAECITEELKR